MRPAGEGRAAGRAEIGPLREAGLDVVRQMRSLERLLRDLDDADQPVGAGNRELAVGEFDVVRPGFHHMGGDLAPLVDQPVGGDDNCRAGELRRA